MGIEGLESFVKELPIFKEFTLNDSELVVDGAALIRTLHQGNTVRYGGEYTTFTRQCECVFSNMKSAGIKMYIIFDGGWAEIKYDIIIERHERKLNRLVDIARGYDRKNVLAVFAMECFMRVVHKFRDTVETHTAPYEADPEVARLAEEKNCLALSSDYDLLLYNLTNGFLPMNKLDISTLKKQPIAADELVQCERVFAPELAEALHIDIDSLPTFAALRMHFHTDKRDGFEKTAKLIKLMNEDCIDECLQMIPPEKKQEWKRKIDDTRRSFQLPYQDKPNPGEAATSDTRIPERMKRLIESGRIYHGALVVWEIREFIPVKQVENFTKLSSNDISRDIRSFWYGIICAGDRVRPTVKEHSRQPAQRGNLNPRSDVYEVELKHEVTFQDCQTSIPITISLSDPESLTEVESKCVLMVALGGEEAKHNLKRFDDDLKRFDDDLKLPLLATRFWLRKVRPADYIKDTIVSILTGNAASYVDSTQRREIPLLLRVAHAYAQWQSCLVSAHDLNIILGSPLSDFRKDILPNGSNLHHRLAYALKYNKLLPKCDSQVLIEGFLYRPISRG